MRPKPLRRIYCRMIAGSSALAAIALAQATPAFATEAPDISICDDLPSDPEITIDRVDPISLPADWGGIATSSRNWIAVWTEHSRTYCVETAWMYEATNLERFGERFLGFNWDGQEAFGYVLIDRARQGREIDTGSRPLFSPDGSKFATLQRSDANFRGFEGFAIWEIYGGVLEPYIVNAGPPLYPMYDWRIDRWEGERCLHISAVPYDRFEGKWESLPSVTRDRYVSSASNDWRILEGWKCEIGNPP